MFEGECGKTDTRLTLTNLLVTVLMTVSIWIHSIIPMTDLSSPLLTSTFGTISWSCETHRALACCVFSSLYCFTFLLGCAYLWLCSSLPEPQTLVLWVLGHALCPRLTPSPSHCGLHPHSLYGAGVTKTCKACKDHPWWSNQQDLMNTCLVFSMQISEYLNYEMPI